MNDKEVLNAIKFSRELSKKRKFEQSVEMTINFKGIDFKKADNRVEVDVKLPHATGKQGNVQSLVFVKDKSFANEIKGKATRVILESEIPNLKKKDVDTIIKEFDVLLAEGPAILAVGKYLGQQLAPKGKMPKPITNSVQSLEQALRGASTLTKVTNKKGKFMPVVHVMVGKESFKDEEILQNVMAVYTPVMNSLPNKEGNIKSVLIKMTMGKPIKVGFDYSKAQEPAAEAKK